MKTDPSGDSNDLKEGRTHVKTKEKIVMLQQKKKKKKEKEIQISLPSALFSHVSIVSSWWVSPPTFGTIVVGCLMYTCFLYSYIFGSY